MKRFLVLLALAVSGGIYAQNGTADASDGWVLEGSVSCRGESRSL